MGVDLSREDRRRRCDDCHEHFVALQMENLSTEDWKTQWTMTNEEWNLVKKDVKANAKGPSDALSGFEDAGLRRVSPDIAAEMLRIVADKAKQSKTEREELSGLRRDSRVAHLIGTCVAAARRGSESLSPKSTVSAAWALAVIAGERANSAEMEVLADRSSVLIKEMSPRQLADLAWALASCRHASHAVFRAMDVSFATDSAKVRKFSPFDLSTLTWAFAHLGAGGVGFVHGLDVWFANGSVPTDIDASDESAVESLTATAATKAQTFTPHALVATAWGLAVLGGDALRSFSFKTIWAEIGRKGAEFGTDQMSDENNVKYGSWMGKHLNQIHQCVVSVDAAGGCEALGLPALPPSLVTASTVNTNEDTASSSIAFSATDPDGDALHKHEEEAFCAGYRVDLFVPQWTGTSIPVAIEVDGPSHFARNDQAVKLGQTRLKHRQLANLGFAVVSVPVADWEYLETSEEKVEYLRCGFEAACAARK